MKNRIILILGVCIIMSASVCAQSNKAVKEDLKKLSAVLIQKRYSYKLTYTLFESYRSIRPLETQVMDIKMWDMMINIKNKDFQVVKNKHHYVYIDPSQKIVMLNKVTRYSDDLKQMNELEKMLYIDTMLTLYSKVDVLPVENEKNKGYRFQMPEGSEYKFVDLIMNKNTGLIDKMILYYAGNMSSLMGVPDDPENSQLLPRMEMQFSNFVVTPKINDTNFSIDPFVEKRNKKYALKEAYASYRLIDNTY